MKLKLRHIRPIDTKGIGFHSAAAFSFLLFQALFFGHNFFKGYCSVLIADTGICSQFELKFNFSYSLTVTATHIKRFVKEQGACELSHCQTGKYIKELVERRPREVIS